MKFPDYGLVGSISSSITSVRKRVEEKRLALWQRRRLDQFVFFGFMVALALLSVSVIQNRRLMNRFNESVSDYASYRARTETRLNRLESQAVATTGIEELANKYGLIELQIIRNSKASFLELHTYDDRGSSSYGTAGYMGAGYFITVKHGVVALGQEGVADPRKIISIKLMYQGKLIPAKLVDFGDARVEVDPGDWAILKVNEPIDLPVLRPVYDYQYEFAEPIFRLGNDYSKGIIVTTGYLGQRTPTGLITSLTDGHPGVSGGGVLNQAGELVAIPIGRMQGDFRFSFMLPLKANMFRKIRHLRVPPA